MIKALCVYCGANAGVSPDYAVAARELARVLVAENISLVYGGGKVGLMGVIADEVLRLGGEVTGVIPTQLVEREVGHMGLTRQFIVKDMHERKAMMAEHADAFLALPGGIGTFEELFEVWTWRQLGYHAKPLGLLNVAGYYDAMLDFLRQSVDRGFMGAWQMDFLQVGTELDALLPGLLGRAGGGNPAAAPLRDLI